jgi:WD40 repeat protein
MSTLLRVVSAVCFFLLLGLPPFALTPEKKQTAKAQVRKAMPPPAGAILRLGEKSGREPPIEVSKIAFSPDGKKIATACPKEPKDPNGQNEGIFKAPLERLARDLRVRLPLDADEHRRDAQIHVWNAATGELLDRINSPHFDVFATIWVSNKDYLDRASERVFKTHYYPNCSPDGKSYVTAYPEFWLNPGQRQNAHPTMLGLFEFGTGKSTANFEVNLRWHVQRQVMCPVGVPRVEPDRFSHLIPSPDGKKLAGVHENNLTVYDIARGCLIHRIDFKGDVFFHCHGIAFSPDARSITSLCSDVERLRGGEPKQKLSFQVWELATGSLRLERAAGLKLTWETPTIFVHDRLFAVAQDHVVHLIDPNTGKLCATLNGHDRDVSALAVSRDRKLLATGSKDSSVVVWELPTMPTAPPERLAEKELGAAWTPLAGDDAGKAYDAMRRLALAEDQAVEHFRKHLKPVHDVDDATLQRWLADLDSEQYALRARATQGLLEQGDRAEDSLKELLADPPSLEFTRRAQAILAQLAARRVKPEGKALQAIRAVEVLEMIGTTAAKRLLDNLAKGSPYNILTREAAASLRRLADHRR